MNKRHFKILSLMLASAIMLSSCHFVQIEDREIIPENCFKEVTPIKATDDTYKLVSEGEDHLLFAVLTDVHVGRENNDPGVIRNHENFYSFYSSIVSRSQDPVDGRDVPVILLGDIADAGGTEYYDLIDEFIDEMRAQRIDADGKSVDKCPMPIIYVPGNHEFMDSDLRRWMMYFGDREDEGLYTLGAYSIGNILFENTNNVYRLYGREQFEAIEYNLKKYGDEYAYKFFLGHIPLGSEKFDQSLFWFVIGDADERNEMLRLMGEYGPSFNLTGHLHQGEQLNTYSDISHEFIFSSFHKRQITYDNGGLWHLLDINQNPESEGAGEVTIYAYDIDTEGIDINNYTDPSLYKWKKTFNMGTK